MRTWIVGLLFLIGTTRTLGADPSPTLFDRMDADGDGRLSATEAPVGEGAFRRLDGNRDGYVSRNEAGAIAVTAPSTSSRRLETDVAMRQVFDVPYTEIEGVAPHRLSLDIYAPPGGDGHPVLLMIHGGGWSIGDKRAAGVVASKAPFFVSNGWVFVSTNYRLSPTVIHPTHVRDVAHALAWIHDHATEYGGDPDRIYVMGHSAGAHLAALVSTDGRRLESAGKDLSILKGAILLDGAGYDLPLRMEGMRAQGMVGRMYAAAFTDDIAVRRDASPIRHVAPDKDIPPFLVLYSSPRPEARSQATAMARALGRAGVPIGLLECVGRNHNEVNQDVGRPDDVSTSIILRFLQGEAPGSLPTSTARQAPR